MRLASWNTRGLGNGSRGRMAGTLVNRFQLQFLAIQETMVKRVTQPILNEIWKHFAFDSIQKEASGRSGGLLSIWRLDFFSLIHSWSCKHWIATILRYLPNNQIVLIVNVYAPHLEHKKYSVWSQVTNMANQWPGPLCFLGDFNSVRSLEERLREVIDQNSIDSFNDFIIQANLIDQVLSNDEFTWEGPLGKFSRINRVLINDKWAILWPDAILQTGPQERWAAFKVAKKLRVLKADLKIWRSSHQDNDEVNLKNIEAKIKLLKTSFQSRDLSEAELHKLVDLKKSKKAFSVRIESKRRLHSRFHWLRLGEKNTRFFHIVSRIRQQSSYIVGMSIDNVWNDDPDVVKENTVSFFESLFATRPSLTDLIDLDWASLNLAQVPAHLNVTLEA
ncbi:uncharacterized protein [Rutidosis leptorrhynchoides]|uniref:uncharacterized protein n=1 Tax=Rutidosis leptorrhynchoides TaxID=125765 RepID=UPI003A99348A